MDGQMPVMGQDNGRANNQNGNMQMPPKEDMKNTTWIRDKCQQNMDGKMPQGWENGKMKGGANGGGKITAGSIVNYVRDRIENIKQQLSGELSTTRNNYNY